MKYPTEIEVTQAIADATRSALIDLFEQHPESYYYISLSSTDAAAPPTLSAWSHEAFERAGNRKTIRWSSSDSPYTMYGWEDYFTIVQDIFDALPDIDNMTEVEWKQEYDFCFSCMENALAILDSEGLFGTGAKRERCVILAEVVPPDSSNTDRAKRLNPAVALVDWLAEAAE